MAITMKEEISEAGPGATPAIMAGLSGDAVEFFRKEMQSATTQAVDRAFGYADAVSRDLMARVKEELAGYAKPKAQILAVEVEGQKRKLSKAAPPYLGRMIVNAKMGLSTILIGPAGSGKTVAAGLLAESLGLQFGQLCLSGGTSETWLFGRQTPNGFIEGVFSQMYREGGVFLLDELDAADANMLLAINTALANGVMYNPISGKGFNRHANFVCVATANTACLGGDVIYTGRNRLDGASLTRFIKIEVDYDRELERTLCPDDELREKMQNAREKLKELRSPYIISTRCIEYAFIQKSQGITQDEILNSLTVGWPDELKTQCGIEPVKKKRK